MLLISRLIKTSLTSLCSYAPKEIIPENHDKQVRRSKRMNNTQWRPAKVKRCYLSLSMGCYAYLQHFKHYSLYKMK